MGLKRVDLNIINGLVWANGELIAKNISILDEKIFTVTTNSELPMAKKTIDAKGYLVLPGAIDSHIHSRDPGSTDREDFYTVTAAAAAGGVTTVLDMPNNIPPISSVENFNLKRKIAEEKAVIDFGLYAGAGSDNIDEITNLANAGAIAFKTFLTKLSPERFQEMKGLIVHNNGSFIEVLKEVRKTDLLYCLHTEDDQIIDYYTDQLKLRNRNDLKAFGESRPPISEISSVARTLTLSKYTDTKIHICHISIPESIKMVNDAKKEGQRVTSEVASIYPFLSEEDLERLGPYGLTYPPLRDLQNRDIIYNSFLNGDIDIINSDHAPYKKEEIERGYNDIWKASPSISTIEVLLPVLLNEVSKGKMSLKRLIEGFIELPARLFKLYPKKGIIQEGSDADIIIVDMNNEKIINCNELHTKIRTTQFEGLKVKGYPITTIVRGKIVMVNNKIIAKPGWGRMIKPAL